MRVQEIVDWMDAHAQREAEIARYHQAYANPNYRMGDRRRRDAAKVLAGIPKGSLLDVGAGRGEGIELALAAGHKPVRGVEPVAYLTNGDTIVEGIATDLPCLAQSYDTVMCLDVLEHLVPYDVELALQEFKRVAIRHVFVTAAENSHVVAGIGEMHISRRPAREWEALLNKAFPFSEIKRLGKIGVSPGFLIEV